MKKITKVVTVSLLTKGIQSSQARFGSGAEDAFPESPNFTAFFDDKNNVVAFGENNFKIESGVSQENYKKLEFFAPFLNGHEAVDWLFNPDDVPVSDEFRPDSIEDLSVCFTWSGDAREIENSLMDEEPDEWQDDFATFQSMLDDSNTVAIGWKYVRECDWSVNSDADLGAHYGQANWDVAGECCFVIQRY